MVVISNAIIYNKLSYVYEDFWTLVQLKSNILENIGHVQILNTQSTFWIEIL